MRSVTTKNKNSEVCEVQRGMFRHSQDRGTSNKTKEIIILASTPKWKNSKETLEVNLNFMYLQRVNTRYARVRERAHNQLSSRVNQIL